jgi:hypothetical protein
MQHTREACKRPRVALAARAGAGNTGPESACVTPVARVWHVAVRPAARSCGRARTRAASARRSAARGFRAVQQKPGALRQKARAPRSAGRSRCCQRKCPRLAGRRVHVSGGTASTGASASASSVAAPANARDILELQRQRAAAAAAYEAHAKAGGSPQRRNAMEGSGVCGGGAAIPPASAAAFFRTGACEKGTWVAQADAAPCLFESGEGAPNSRSNGGKCSSRNSAARKARLLPHDGACMDGFESTIHHTQTLTPGGEMQPEGSSSVVVVISAATFLFLRMAACAMR